MPSVRNKKLLEALKDKFSRSKSVFFADYTGLAAGEQTDLRAKVADAGGEFGVAKNTLLQLALEVYETSKKKKNGSFVNFLTGPTAAVFSYQDEIMPLKTVAEFFREHEKPIIKGGMLSGKLLSAKEVLRLAELPSKEELIIRLMGQMQRPMDGMVKTLNGNAVKLIYALKAIREKHN